MLEGLRLLSTSGNMVMVSLNKPVNSSHSSALKAKNKKNLSQMPKLIYILTYLPA